MSKYGELHVDCWMGNSHMGNGMRYWADITTAGLKVPESKRIADIVLQDSNETGWKEALYDQNNLLAWNPTIVKGLALLL